MAFGSGFRKKYVGEWLFLGTTAIALCLATLATSYFHSWSHNIIAYKTQLNRLQITTNRLDALEWRAIAQQKVHPTLQVEIEAQRQRVEATFAEIEAIAASLYKLEEIRSTYDQYTKAVDQLLQLLQAGEIAAALEIDEEKVDPAFEKLHKILAEEDAAAAYAAARVEDYEFWGSNLTSLALIVGIGVVFYWYQRADRKTQLALIKQENMRQTEQALKQERTLLEIKVIERTREIQEKNAVLAQTLSDLKQSQMKLIQTEKMSSLGQLVTGIAHEINTPLGAIQSSVGNITHALQQALKKLPALLQTLPPERIAALLLLLEWGQQPQEPLSSREERQLKRQIKQSLEDHGIAQADKLSSTLSKMGIAVALDPILPLLQIEDAPSMLQTVYQLAVVQNNSQNIRLAVERASRIVYALRNFARRDSLGIPSYASISEGIETVLMLYQNQIKQGIEVETQYAELPLLIGYPEELVQVWSNLVSNAIQSMNYRGKLAIATSQQGQHIMVQIADTGKGISPDIQDKIFEPFFTTKARGEGTGLGLSIVKNIIDKHHGKIEVESQTGQTTFRVYLPLQTLPEPLAKATSQR